MGRLIFVIEEKVALNFFTVPLIIFFFFISSTSAPTNQSKRQNLNVLVLVGLFFLLPECVVGSA